MEFGIGDVVRAHDHCLGDLWPRGELPAEDQPVCIVCRDEPVEEEGATCWRCEEIERNLNV